MKDTAYFDAYEERLTAILLEQCSSKGFLAGELLQVEELEEKWKECAPEYMADAVPEINNYPTVAVVWAAYFGMGLAALWDKDWNLYEKRPDLYRLIASERGFDCMDEYIAEDILLLELESDAYRAIEELMRSCATTTVSMMRHENIEAGTPAAFYVFARSTRALFRLGVALELKRLGYKYEKINVELPHSPDVYS